MYELKPGMPYPELEISSMDSKNILKILELRLRCREEKKVGGIYAGFGRMFYIGSDGEYIGEVPPEQKELDELLAKFSS